MLITTVVIGLLRVRYYTIAVEIIHLYRNSRSAFHE